MLDLKDEAPREWRMTTEDLLTDLGSNPDYAALVQRVTRDRLTWVVVARAAVTDWSRQDPAGWSKVAHWLQEQGVTLVEI
jgi:hypothetical protein